MNKDQLKQFILEEWDRITQKEMNDLVLTMVERINSIIVRKEFPTPY